MPASPSFAIGCADNATLNFCGLNAGAMGDVDGDGLADVILGATGGRNTTGLAYVYPGSASGLSATPTLTLLAPDGFDSHFGYAVARAPGHAPRSRDRARAVPGW